MKNKGKTNSMDMSTNSYLFYWFLHSHRNQTKKGSSCIHNSSIGSYILIETKQRKVLGQISCMKNKRKTNSMDSKLNHQLFACVYITKSFSINSINNFLITLIIQEQ